MTVASWPRLIAVSVFAIGLALGLAVQALSSVSTRSAPSLAVSAFGANGLAKEQLAFEVFTTGVSEPDDVPEAAREAATIALEAVRADPLAPKAHAILAMAATDEAERREILAAAGPLNRRDISLQGLILQGHLADQNYNASIETLDQILRVHPETSREFFPVLADALKQEETVPLFAEILENSSPWHARFLNFAVGQRDVLPNLAVLRPQIDVDRDSPFDRRLIAGLAGLGDVSGAEALYQNITGAQAGLLSEGALDWSSAYPPFDWRLVDESGFRAQQSPDGSELELSVRPGKGGIIAARLLGAPQGPFVIAIDHRIAPADQMRDVRLQLICAGETAPFYDERFSRGEGGFEVPAPPPGCSYMVIAINARAWSGRSALSGTIEQIRIRTQ